MKNLLILTILLLPITAAAKDRYFYIDIGAGSHTNFFSTRTPWNNADSMGCMFAFGYVTPIRQNIDFDANWSHYSQCMAGPPFNNELESALDHVGAKVRFKF